MDIEVYEKDCVNNQEIGDERIRLCKALGLNHQATVSEKDPSEYYEELRTVELNFWIAFLPTRYASDVGMFARPWSGYAFDHIPLNVLRHIHKAQQSRLFDSIEIWTPERSQGNDPIAVGVLNGGAQYQRSIRGRFFKIVRWGESLKPWDELLYELNKDSGSSAYSLGRFVRAFFE